MNWKKPIGLFDSGIGGLTVLRQLQKLLPHEDFIYFADTAHLPYGEKSGDEIIEYTHQILSWMQSMGVKLAIAACNTCSAVARDVVSQNMSFPVIGTIYPLIDLILHQPIHAKLGILVTPASAKSRMHEKILIQAGFQGDIELLSCPEFVPLIEEGNLCGPKIQKFAQDYLMPFHAKQLTTLVYGCTHYPWIAQTLQNLLPPTTHFIDPANMIAIKASEHLHEQNMLNPSLDKGTVMFYCSRHPDKLASQLSMLMSIQKPHVSLVHLEDSTVEQFHHYSAFDTQPVRSLN